MNDIQGYNFLNNFQKDIITECLKKKSGGLSLPMGSGKTLLSIVLSRIQIGLKEPILIITSKSLVHSWSHEINKFSLGSYKIIDKDFDGDLSKTQLYITTPDLLIKYYKLNNISEKFVYEERNTTLANDYFSLFENRFRTVYRTAYRCIDAPVLKNMNGPNIIYSIKWGSLIIDEIQKFSNIETKKCQSISTICSNFTWGLSGTIIDEPKITKILGLFIMMKINSFPRNIPEALEFISNESFKGLKHYIVHRDTNIEFKEPIVNKQIINHDITMEESMLYLTMKSIINKIKKRVNEYQRANDVANTRKFNSYACFSFE